MSENSLIQWTTNTWNPWHGCTKVSDGCKFCYMYRDKERYGQDPTTVLRSKTKFNDPLKWHKLLTGDEPIQERLVFTCSWSDWFIEDADEWRGDAWKIIKDTPFLTYQILTKRPENIADRLPSDWSDGYPNVWLGVSIENKKVQDERIPILLSVPAMTRFLSVEPLLESLSFRWMAAWKRADGSRTALRSDSVGQSRNLVTDQLDGLRELDWLILGGESGNENSYYKYRPSQLEWYAEIISQCREARVPVFMKQLGTYLGKQMKLRDSHGGNIDEWPERLQVREFPI